MTTAPDQPAPSLSVLRLVAALHACDTLAELERVLARRVRDVVAADRVTLDRVAPGAARPMRAPCRVGLPLRITATTTVTVGLHRTGRDFSDAEFERLTLLHEQLPAAIDHVRLRELYAHERRAERVHELTQREAQVLRCVRAGMSNQTIADTLHLGRRTIEKHLERMYAKLGVSTRTAAVHAVWPPGAAA